MIASGRVQRVLTVVLVSLLFNGMAPSQTASPAAFAFAPAGSPAKGQVVQFNDTSTNGPTSWLWDFGDGQSSTDRNPTHVFAAPGAFQVTLTTTKAGTPSRTTQEIFVSDADTLQLNNRADHPFTVKLVATNQRTGETASGQAIPQNDLFGYFAIPAFTGSPENPEVFVKLLDGTAVNGEFWVFYGHLTDLVYDLTVTEVATGISKTYHKDAGNSAGGFDTSGFHAGGPAPTPTVPAATPTPAPTTPAVVTVNLVASDFRWDFDGGGDSFTFRVGQPYQLRIRRSNGIHGFSGIPTLGCSGATLASTAVCNFTPTAAQIGTHGFACTVSSCGSGHTSMLNGQAIVAR
ncbi:MAG TPA: PKD domain-containing protein [Thermoanaerobaculia bacterium]|nr:PKD domain-containing protein [Thermoanaerobaculia bacterium]